VKAGALAAPVLLTCSLVTWGCGSSGGSAAATTQAGGHGCLAQAVATYDFVRLVRRSDGTLWKAAQGPSFERIGAADFRGDEIAASGSSAYSNAIGCARVKGGVWCFPLAGPLGAASDLGAGANADASTEEPQRVLTGAEAGAAPLEGVKQLSGGQNGGGASFCGVTEAGQVWCWGYSVNALLGQRASEHTDHAEPLLGADGAPFDHVVEVRVGYDATCVRRDDGSVWCLGSAEHGALGFVPTEADPPSSAVPRKVTLSAQATRLAASPGSTQCAILADSTVQCWGHNHYGQAGAPDSELERPPTLVLTAEHGAPLAEVVDLAPDRGMEAMCANTAARGVWCWGHAFTAGPERQPTGCYAAPAYAADADVGVITVPLSSYGATNGKLVLVDERGRLVFGAGAEPTDVQPSCL